jgi:hypothetical protein
MAINLEENILCVRIIPGVEESNPVVIKINREVKRFQVLNTTRP